MSRIVLHLLFLSAIQIAFLLAFGCSHGTKPALSEAEIIAIDERAVYAIVLRDLFPKTGEGKYLAISDKSLAYVESRSGWVLADLEVRVAFWKKDFPNAEISAIESYEYQFERPTAFTEADFGEVHLPLLMVDETKIDETRPVLPDEQKPNHVYGPSLQDLAPGADGLIRISRPGFNTGRTQALLKIDYVNCPLCGFGMSIFLEKQNGAWSIIDRSIGWES